MEEVVIKNLILKLYFKTASFLISLIAKLINGVRVPFSKKKTHFYHVQDALKLMQSGDIILLRTNGELTTLLIPGQFKHAAIYAGSGVVIEAVSPEVTSNSLVDVLMHSDSFAVVRLKQITEEERTDLCFDAYKQIGKKYDFGLEIYDDNEMYCSEIIYRCINNIRPNYLHLRDRLGYPTFSPMDCMDPTKFDFIYKK